MPNPVLVSPEEYLHTSYGNPDREYVHGEVLERSTPTFQHGKIVILLGILFADLIRRKLLFVAAEVRLAVDAPHRYRIPDVAVFMGEEPVEPVPSHPPLIAIEIASPDDRISETLEKFDEYWRFGVAHIWLIDPEKKKLYTYDATGLHPVRVLSLPAYSLQITLADLDLA